jgi:hypothetical protein
MPDFFTQPISQRQFKKASGGDGTLKYFFYDINGAIRHKVNEKNTLSWSMYAGNDFYTFGETRDYRELITITKKAMKTN